METFINVRITAELKNALEGVANKEHESLSAIVRVAIFDFLVKRASSDGKKGTKRRRSKALGLRMIEGGKVQEKSREGGHDA